MEHAASGPEWAAALEATSIGVAMRQSLYAYPVANLVHLLGLVLLVGPIMLLDLRALGAGRAHVSFDAASRLLNPFALAGLLLLIASGPLLFLADARALSTSALLWTKLALVAVGIANALAFRALWKGRRAVWDAAPPLLGRAQALGSLTIWLAVAGLGRMIAYL